MMLPMYSFMFVRLLIALLPLCSSKCTVDSPIGVTIFLFVSCSYAISGHKNDAVALAFRIQHVVRLIRATAPPTT